MAWDDRCGRFGSKLLVSSLITPIKLPSITPQFGDTTQRDCHLNDPGMLEMVTVSAKIQKQRNTRFHGGIFGESVLYGIVALVSLAFDLNAFGAFASPQLYRDKNFAHVSAHPNIRGSVHSWLS